MNEDEDFRESSDATLAETLLRLKGATPSSERPEGKRETAAIPFEGFDESPRGRPGVENAE